MAHGTDDLAGFNGAPDGFRRRAKDRRRSRHSRNGLVIAMSFVFTVALAGVVIGGAAFAIGKRAFDAPGPLQAETTVMVPRGGGLSVIADNLETSGVINNALVFEYGVRLEGSGGDLKAGEYAFAPGISMRGAMEVLRDGSSIQHSVSIPEGWTVQQIYNRLEADPTLEGELPPLAPEGTLLPDTYLFTRGMTRAQIVQQMTQAQTQLVERIWEGRQDGLPLEDVGQFVTLASIVERETGVAAERPHVASVFINRLRDGMRLQSDPTFIYGIWGGAGKPSGEPLRRSHIDSDTPYNTYVIRGLPPGPIANPGRAALEAVAHPLDADDLYFVADGTGGHAFARTLNEHNANVRRYREFLRENAAANARAAETESEAIAAD